AADPGMGACDSGDRLWHSLQFRSRLERTLRQVSRQPVQLLGEHTDVAGLGRTRNAGLQLEYTSPRHAPAGGRWTDGTYELFDAKCYLHDSVLRLRVWPLRLDRACRPDRHRGRHLGATARRLARLAALLSVWPG